MKKININTLEISTCISLLIYVTVSYIFRIQYHPVTLNPNGFINTLMNSFGFFAIFFSIGSVISYLRNFSFQVITDHLFSLWILPIFTFICACFYFSIFRYFNQPYCTNALLVINGAIFGLSFQSELTDESSNLKTISKFDHSLSDNVYHLLITLFIIFPIEFYASKLIPQNFLYMLCFYGSLLLVWFILSSKLSKLNIFSIEISKDNNVQTSFFVILFWTISVIGLVVWDVTALSNSMIENTILHKIIYLVCFGLIPIRLIPVVFCKSSLLLRIFNISSLTYYIVFKLYYYKWFLF